MNYEEETEDITMRELMLMIDYDGVRSSLDEHYSDYDCQLIAKRLKSYTINKELQIIMNMYKYSFQQGVDKLIDDGFIKMW